jgi:hypothetical protein
MRTVIVTFLLLASAAAAAPVDPVTTETTNQHAAAQVRAALLKSMPLGTPYSPWTRARLDARSDRCIVTRPRDDESRVYCEFKRGEFYVILYFKDAKLTQLEVDGTTPPAIPTLTPTPTPPAIPKPH